jgi:extracellular matrix regulatory protein A
MKLINIGYGNTVNSDRVIAAVSADAAPVKRIISAAKDNNTAIDAPAPQVQEQSCPELF